MDQKEKKIVELNDKSFEEIISKKSFFLVDFWAEWCNPCKIMLSNLTKVNEKYKKDCSIFKINVEKNQKTVGFYNICSVPTLAVFKKKKLVKKCIGLMSEKKIKDLLDSFF